MMEHYNTQAIDAHNLWLQGLRELALRQARARDMSRPQASYLGKTLHEMWQHLVLQGWELIFTPPPHQKNYSGAEAQQNPAEVAPEKEIDDSEFRAASVEVAENNQETWAPFKGSSEIERFEEAHEKQETAAHSAAGTGEWERPQWMKCDPEAPARDHRGAWKTFLKNSEMEEEEEQEKRGNKDEIVSFSKQGTKVWECSSLLRNSTEIRPEAPILKTELSRDNLGIPEKGFSSSERGQNCSRSTSIHGMESKERTSF